MVNSVERVTTTVQAGRASVTGSRESRGTLNPTGVYLSIRMKTTSGKK